MPLVGLCQCGVIWKSICHLAVERPELLLLSALLSAFVLTVELTYDNISIKTLLCNIGVFLG